MIALKEILLKNWNLKLTAVFMAFVLWLLVRGEVGAERVLSVPLEIRVPRNMEITSERPNSVDVTVRGASSNLWFSPSLPAYTIDLQMYAEGDHTVQLSPENVRFARASGLEAVAVRPARLRLRLERTVPKEVSVRVVLRGDPAAGIEVYSTTIIPGRVVLTGPRSSIEKMQEVATEPIPIGGQSQPIRTFVSLDIRDDAVHSSPSGPVEVNIRLGPRRRLQRIARVPVETDASSFVVSPAAIAVNLLVPAAYGKTLAAADLIATVATAQIGQGPAAVKIRPDVRLRNPEDPGIVIRDILPPEVAVQRRKN